MAIYGMGLTQHRAGVETVQMLVNLLLLRGNIGRPGAGICPVRGHSNVQGQRTVGITEKPSLVPMDTLSRQYHFQPPSEPGYNTVEACEAILAGKIEAFVMLGGNFVRAIPDRDQMEPAWRRMRLTVNVATKLNRSHLVHGAISFVLPVLGRIERDIQVSGEQSISMEDSTACIHGSRGVRAPASRHLISEVKLVAEIAKATLDPNPHVPWDDWVDDYSRIRTAIGDTYPEVFHDYDRRMWEPGGFHRSLPARDRVWKTKTEKANFITPRGLDEDKDAPELGHDVLRMITLRSNDQFNTTIYGYDDRFRGVHGTRMVVLMNQDDIDRLGLREGDEVMLRTSAKDHVRRAMGGFRVTPYNIPTGCIGTYYPEANTLVPIWHYAEGSKTPAAKSVPVTVERSAAT
jgi:molybdopterin-dependent oxidoreductase alpha subunit